MRVLVTGSAGHIGRALVQTLRAAGHEVRTFDRVARGKDEDWEHIPGDLRDSQAVRRAVQGVDAVAHLGAISSDRRGGEEDVLAVNVQGTWNVLLACVEAHVGRVVYFSSVQALGIFTHHREAPYLPIDDDCPRHPMTPYQLSKHLSEEMCRSFTERHGLVTVCLRPVGVTVDEHFAQMGHYTLEDRVEWGKHEYWAYVDREDVCDATLLALTVENVTHDAFLLTADDICVEPPTAELVDRFHPNTPWKQDRAAYLADDPHRSLVDCAHAKQVLGWQPKRSWRT